MTNDALASLAQAMRKSDVKRRYLPQLRVITPLQATWVRCLLSVWGEKYGGYIGPDSASSVLGRLMIRKEWNDRESARIMEVVDNLHKQGYKGNELFLKAQQMINPNNSVSSLLERANEQEDADLVESVITQTFAPDNPIRVVAIKHYCERKCSQDIAKELSRLTGITPESSWRRVKWCRELLEASVYHAIMADIEANRTNIAA